ncbi:MAG: helix-turn-helix domain-containing protein [Tannerellaceae bacterium]|nr:helix-turn-helix domain-containing protein [Tannerellaceae bacterium]
MRIITIEAQTFEDMLDKFELFSQKVNSICRSYSDKSMEKWLDNQDVCQILDISKRSLQTYRDNGTLPYSQIGNKMYYKPKDIEQILSPTIKKRIYNYERAYCSNNGY